VYLKKNHKNDKRKTSKSIASGYTVICPVMDELLTALAWSPLHHKSAFAFWMSKNRITDMDNAACDSAKCYVN